MNRIKSALAALVMFTRLPLWRLYPHLGPESYRQVVTYWPLAGWLTSGVCAGVYVLLLQVVSAFTAAVCAVGARMLFTGAYHEDGLADFSDGFGGGRDREGVLAIMKDSHIGSYGVISLVMFLLLLVSLISSLDAGLTAAMIFGADPFSKFCAGRMTGFLRYARENSVAKNKSSYTAPGVSDTLISLLLGTLPMLAFWILSDSTLSVAYTAGMLASIISSAGCMFYMSRRVGGYTGDCCGATYLISEASFCLIFTIIVL